MSYYHSYEKKIVGSDIDDPEFTQSMKAYEQAHQMEFSQKQVQVLLASLSLCAQKNLIWILYRLRDQIAREEDEGTR